MSDYRLTPHNFDTGGLRSSLRHEHKFEHTDIERAKGVILKAVEHVEHKTNTNSGMGAHHLDMAMNFLNKDPAIKSEWKKIPSTQRAHIETALKDHFGVAEAEKEAA